MAQQSSSMGPGGVTRGSNSNTCLTSDDGGGGGTAIIEEECPINCVQMSGLVVMKIIKHYNDESTLNLSQGALLGLVVDKCLEVTNCFAIPYNKTNDESYDDVSYQLAVMHRWKSMNVDNFHVGWYQSSDIGSCLSLNLLEAQFLYQTNIEESVVIVYDTVKSTRGFLCFKAYRLTPQAIRMYKENNFVPEVLRSLKVGFETLFTEVPIVIKNSPLTNIMMSELTELLPEEEGNNFLDLGTATVLESDIRSLIDRMDELYPEVLRYNRYQQILLKQETEKNRALTKQAAENVARAARGESPISDEDVLKQFRPIPGPQRLSTLITSGQINNYAQHMSQLCTQSLAKLFITESLQKAKDSCSREAK